MKTKISSGTALLAVLVCLSLSGLSASADPHSETGKAMENNTVTWSAKLQNFRKPADTELRNRLSKLQYEVTQKDATERPFQNEFWDNKQDGIYVDVISGEPLFSSTHKYKSGTGWPSFFRPIHEEAMVTRPDRGLFYTRTELRSKVADSHLGHVFDDGPAPTGLRYCINSASLKFIPKQQLEAQGYGEFLSLFE